MGLWVWQWGIFRKILSFPLNNVMDMNNVMLTVGIQATLLTVCHIKESQGESYMNGYTLVGESSFYVGWMRGHLDCGNSLVWRPLSIILACEVP